MIIVWNNVIILKYVIIIKVSQVIQKKLNFDYFKKDIDSFPPTNVQHNNFLFNPCNCYISIINPNFLLKLG